MARPLTFDIDARAAAEVPAGRGRYVRELLRGLTEVDDPHARFVLWGRERWADELVDADPRFEWHLVVAPDPAWHLLVALRARGDAFLSTNSYLTAWATRAPTAITVFDLVAFDPAAHAQPRAARIERATIRPALRRAAALACISGATRDELVARFPAVAPKCSVIPLAADPRFSRPLGHALLPVSLGLQGRPYVLAVGTLEPRKNLERLVRAWTRVPADGRGEHVLALVGPRGWEDEPILRAAHEAGAVLLGHVDDDVLHRLYAGATAFAYPSLAEGFGLPVLEAMAAGAPVLTSDRSSLPEVAGDAALLVDPTDEGAIASGLRRLLEDSALRDDLRARGSARAALQTRAATSRATYDLLAAIAQT